MTYIEQLDDATAQRILSAITQEKAEGLGGPVPDSADLRAALSEYFAVAAPPSPASAGELARHALLVLAQDPDTRLAIESLASTGPSDRRHTLDGAVSITLTAAVLIALRTQLEISRDRSGKWSFKLKTKSLADSTLKPLVEKLISYLPK